MSLTDTTPRRAGLAALSLAALLAAAALPAVAGDGLAVGATLPAYSGALTATDGSTMSLADARGERGTLVVFTCNTCPWVKLWEQRIADLGNRYASRGIGVVAINSNDPKITGDDTLELIERRASKLGMQFPYVADKGSKLAKLFGARVTPEAYLFDANGTLVYHGTVDDNAKDEGAVENAYLRDALEAVANGGSVPVAETKALGCGIKYYKGS